MAADHDRGDHTADLRARLVGNALSRDAEDAEFWRHASEQLRGRTLYRLRARGRAMYDAVPHVIEQRDDSVRLVLKPHHVELLSGYE